MARVTSQLQVTGPKAVADRLAIKPGDDIEWHVEGTSARVTRAGTALRRSLDERLAIFDESTRRQDARNRASPRTRRARAGEGRGWTREELHTRGGSR